MTDQSRADRARVGLTARSWWRSAPVRRHAYAVLAAMIIVGALLGWRCSVRATEQAEEASAAQVRAAALALAVPLTSADIIGDDRWMTRLETAVGPRLANGDIVAVHVWRRIDQTIGQLYWSTDQTRAGSVVPLGGAAVALDTGEPVVERLGDGRESEGPPLPNLYEIYLPFADRTGTHYVLEIYQPVHDFEAIRSALLRDWLPIPILGVLLVGAVTFPLSLRLARAVAVAERDRALFADRALKARAEEHRRMAERLHERTVQDLAAARLILEGVRDLPVPTEVTSALDQANTLLAGDIQDLRRLLSSGEATEWQTDDLDGALAGWLDTLPAPGLVRVELPAQSLPLAHPDVAVAFRVIKEAVRNAVKHAQASRVEVRVSLDKTGLTAEIRDDGVGCDPGAWERSTGVGLRLMRYAATSAGGTLSIRTRADTGTTVLLRLPPQPPKNGEAHPPDPMI